ncbi:glutamate--tRNA ligase [Sulfurospirillum arcachonense]|uniref:glutamate--tRNA ligase n=1 Tax=Sulfurospirillum arcachonense TaxID=57666 RepID=UPI00046897CD|nr:glutamate--tRNA ligase family protein [Sulfurospirillum arcachonense]
MYRFSAAPTKDLHVGELRIALFNYICAKQSNKQFIVRIEDIDKAKNIDGKDQEILDILAIFGMRYDYLYYQSENFKYHLQFASSLMDKGKAFACFCTEKELKKQKSYSGKCINISQDELLNNNLPFTIRIKKPTEALHVKDTLQGNLTFKSDEVDSFVIMEQNKYPTSNFANACDDMLQGISHIINEKRYVSEIPKQEMVRKSLGYTEDIRYTHIPEILNADNTSIKFLIDQGFLPESIINYLILKDTSSQEIFTLDEAIECFKIEDISKDLVTFDLEKLCFFNRKHINRLDDIQLSKIIGYASNDIGKLAKLFSKEVSTTYEIKQKVDKVFAQKNSDKYNEDLEKLKNIVKEAPYFENFNDFKAYLMQNSELENEKFENLLSTLLTGEQSTSNLEALYALIKNYLQEIAR